MSNQLEILAAQRRVLVDLCADTEITVSNMALRMCSLAITPNLALDYARALGEYEATKAFASRMKETIRGLDKEISNFKPS